MNYDNNDDWSDETDRVLRAAGWYPGRNVSTEDWENVLRTHGSFTMHDAARLFLAEFGGLEVESRGAGRSMARMAFRLDPAAAKGEDEIFDELGDMAGTLLYPIGEADRRNLYLGIAPDGEVYSGMDSVELLGVNPRRALRNLVEGVREHESS
ncbi:SUKH-3 domain-containing protein [Amycolatopsis sp. H20-H5]|uniref:SUKH-3 domain-containing protein n=1 Tax=Amycolatopsis sp. H20-H5 TaxID=3046309 RepID=UPI002DB9D62E|nr:SUKH-3 domain-containing protein [Amycolatopsis sp. H20-H5]MEC3977797.1 SUKH-3 domain-containing protein [Amycolatopsis sp. H20-H5]